MAASHSVRVFWIASCVVLICQITCATTTEEGTTTPPPSTTPFVPGLGDRCTDTEECAQPPTEVCVNHTCECAPTLVNTTDRYCVAQPGKVSDFNYTIIAEDEVTLEWGPPSTLGVIQEYRIFVMDGGQCVHGIWLGCQDTGPKDFNSSMSPCVPFNTVGNVDCHEDSFSFNHTFPRADVEYRYILSANNQLFRGDNSTLEIRSPIQPALVPGTPVVMSWMANSMLVEWKQPKQRTGPTTYSLDVLEAVSRRGKDMKKLKTITLKGYNTTRYNVTGLLSSWDYSFTVSASTEAGVSALSNVSTPVRTLPSAPGEVTSLQVQALSSPLMGVVLSWQCPDERKRNGMITSYTIQTKGQILQVQKYGLYDPEDPCIDMKSLTLPVINVNYTFTVIANAEYEGKSQSVKFQPDPSSMMYALPANVITHPKVYSSTAVIAVSVVGSVVIVLLILALIATIKRRRSYGSAKVSYSEKSALPNRSAYGSDLNKKNLDIY